MPFQTWFLTAAMRRRAARLGLTLVFLSLVPGSSSAQSSVVTTEAKELFQQARAAVKKGNLAQALVLFGKSRRLHPAAGTLLNMANCEEQLGLTASASQHFKELTARLSANDERLPFAKKRIAALEPRVPWLRLDLAPGAPVGTSVTRDDVEIERSNLGTDRPVDPGKHEIVVTAPGRRERRYEVTAVEGKHDQLTVEPGHQAVPTPTTTASHEGSAPVQGASRSGGSARRTAGFILGSAGLAGLSAGAVTGMLAIKSKDFLEQACPRPKQCSPAGLEVEATGKALATASTVALVVGLSSLGVGTYLVVSSRDRPAITTAVTPLILPGGAGIGISGSF